MCIYHVIQFNYAYAVLYKIITSDVETAGTEHAVSATKWHKTGRPGVDGFTQQLCTPLAAVVQRLFPQQTRDVMHPVAPNLCWCTAQCVRGSRKSLAKPQLKRVTVVTHILRQPEVRRLQSHNTTT